ncbi:MAG TPA: hypothetical protein VFN22_14100 [Gemmatimonadales bacterium]|nr:hypothetical protein [Gemmatimonadales bacterium]
MRRLAALATLLAACSSPPADSPESPSEDRHAYVWSMAGDSLGRDALLVLDVDTTSNRYGRIIGGLLLDTPDGMPHHIERRVHDGGRLVANGWMANTSWVFDLSDPVQPVVTNTFRTAGGVMGWAHDFSRLPNGHLLVAFNGGPGAYTGPGGIAEIDADGAVVQSAMAMMPGLGDTAATPYVVTPVPGRDRLLVGLSEMGMGPDYPYHNVNMLQLWSTIPLAPLTLVPLPPSGNDLGHVATSSIATTANGEMFANTFGCGLYHVSGFTGDTPTAARVFTFPGDIDEAPCGVATTVGDYWIQAVAALPGLMVLDLTDPEAPREVSRLTLDSAAFEGAHWVSANKSGTRIALTGSGSWLLMARFDPATGQVSIDEGFGSHADRLPGIDVHDTKGRVVRPHGVAWGP